MKRNRTYYCNSCKECIDFKVNDDHICKCGYIFGASFNISDGINMRRNKWSGQTKGEVSQTTIDDDIADRNRR